MIMIENPLYRAHITSEPAFEDYEAWDDRHNEVVPWRRPVGWRPDADYIERFGTSKYFPPRTDGWYKSRSSAARRVKHLEALGYTAIVQRSAPVEWPADGEKTVHLTESQQMMRAIATLVEHKVIKSADELLGGRR